MFIAIRNGMALLADASIRALLLAGCAALILTLSRTRRADVRHAVWSTIVLAMLLMPLATAFLPAVPLRVLQPKEALPTAGEPSVHNPLDGSRAVGTLTIGLSRSQTIPARRFDWILLGGSIYAIGVFISAARLLRAYSTVRSLVRNATPANAGAWECPAINVPMTVGLIAPAILLPSSWRNWDRATLSAVLAHERAHVDRLDWLVALVASLNRCIFWFHPLAWWLQKTISALAEDAADDHSILAIGDRQQYAAALVDIASALNTYRGRVTWETVAMARQANVSRRVYAILDYKRPLSRGLSTLSWTAICAFSIPLFYGTAAGQLQPRSNVGGSAAVQFAGNEHAFLGNNPVFATPDEAAKVEQRLRENPDDLEARSRLIEYYFSTGDNSSRVGHVLWIIEHHPDLELLAEMPVPREHGLRANRVQISRDPGSAGYVPGAYERAEQLWIANESKYPDNVRVLINEAAFYAATDLNRAETFLANARRISENPRQIESRMKALYIRVLNATNDPRWTSSTYNDRNFADHIKDMFMRSSDPVLLRDFAKRLDESAEASQRAGVDTAQITRLAQQLRERAQSIDPSGAAQAPVGASAPEKMEAEMAAQKKFEEERAAGRTAAGTGTMHVRVDETVQEAKKVKGADPEYPALARQARVQGTVRLLVRIGTDGQVKGLETIDGHPLLIAAARAAVEKWEYQPTLVNGIPAEVQTTTDVHFTLPQ